MKIYVTTDHDAFYPVGAASVAVAKSEEDARRLIDTALTAKGLKGSAEKPYTLREVKLGAAEVLVDGDY